MSKERKKPSTERVRDKARSQDRLVCSIGDILVHQSYADLNISKVTKISKLNPKLIYLYFESLDGLIGAYIKRKESQKETAHALAKHMASVPHQVADEDVYSLIETQFEEVMHDPEWQGILHWGLSAKNEKVVHLLKQRTEAFDVVLDILNKNKDLAEKIDPVLYALLAAGTTFIATNARVDGAKLLGLDLNSEETKQLIKNTVEKLLMKDL